MDNDATPAVEIAGVTKRFGDVTAVDNIDLNIADGEFFALLGPSGCGKTTTLRMIAGLDFPTEGSLKIFGSEVEPAYLRSRTASLPDLVETSPRASGEVVASSLAQC